MLQHDIHVRLVSMSLRDQKLTSITSSFIGVHYSRVCHGYSLEIYQHGIQKRRFGRWCSFSIGWFFRFQFRSFSRELLASGSFWRQTGLEGGIFVWIVITFCPTKAMPKHHRTSLCRFHSFPVYSNMSCGEFALQIVFTAFHSRSAIPNTHFLASKSFPCTLYTYIIRDFQCNSWSKSWHVSNCNSAAIKSLAIGFQLFIWNLWTQGTKTAQWQHSIKKCSYKPLQEKTAQKKNTRGMWKKLLSCMKLQALPRASELVEQSRGINGSTKYTKRYLSIDDVIVFWHANILHL